MGNRNQNAPNSGTMEANEQVVESESNDIKELDLVSNSIETYEIDVKSESKESKEWYLETNSIEINELDMQPDTYGIRI